MSDNDSTTTTEAEVEELQEEIDNLKRRVGRLDRENEKLKQPPLFVASVLDCLDGNEVIIRQHGNEQEAITEVTEEVYEQLNFNDRVVIDNSLNIVRKIPSENHSDAKAFQVNTTPDTTYSDIGGLTDEITEVREAIEKPIANPDIFETVGIDPPSGVLLHGPPGTGKTMLAKAVANNTDSTFLSLAGSDLAKKFVGEGAQLVKSIFEAAKEEAPTIVFIDEIDAIAAKRTDSKTSGDGEIQRTLIQLLNEMDGFSDAEDVAIVGATNRLDMLDEAILRPGRFDRKIEVGEPDVDARKEIFEVHTRDMNLSESVSLHALAKKTTEMTGADIESVCTEAGMLCIRDEREEITQSDFDKAYSKITEDKQADMDTQADTNAFA